MNILVCISRVPDTAARILVGSDGKTIDKQNIKFIINPYDEFAIEEALRIKEKSGGEPVVTAVSVSNDDAKEQLRTALAMKVDRAVFIKSADAMDSYQVAYNIAEFAKELKPDLIFLGRQSVDYDSLQIPSMLGELLGMPSVSVVSGLKVDTGKITAERDIEGGKETVEAPMPCIISAQKGLNEPRYPKLPDIMKAKSKPIEEIPAKPAEAWTEVLSMEIPSKQRLGKMFADSQEDVDNLVKLLHEEAKVI